MVKGLSGLPDWQSGAAERVKEQQENPHLDAQSLFQIFGCAISLSNIKMHNLPFNYFNAHSLFQNISQTFFYLKEKWRNCQKMTIGVSITTIGLVDF